MNGFQFLDIVLFAAIAAFFVLRLRSVLGKRTGHQKPPEYDPFARRRGEEAEEDKVIPLPDRAGQGRAGAHRKNTRPGDVGAQDARAARHRR